MLADEGQRIFEARALGDRVDWFDRDAAYAAERHE
jgi:hypothetical protein